MTRTLRTLVTGAALLTMALGLAACGGSSTAKPAATTAPSTTTTTAPTTTTTTSGASPSSSAACKKLSATLSNIDTNLPKAATSSNFSNDLQGYVKDLESESANASSSVKSAVSAFVNQLEAAGKGNVNISALTTDAGRITSACSGG